MRKSPIINNREELVGWLLKNGIRYLIQDFSDADYPMITFILPETREGSAWIYNVSLKDFLDKMNSNE